MKPRIFLVLIILLLSLFVFLGIRQVYRSQTSDFPEPRASITNALMPLSKQPTGLANTKANGPLTQASKPIPGTHSNLFQSSFDDWRTPITFYGMVLDEQDNPVSDASIQFLCNDLSEKGTSYYDRKSDENGLFSLTGVQGHGISVHVTKEGYYNSTRSRDSFEYAGQGDDNFIANPGTPVIFRLRKKGKGEALIHIAGLGLHTMRDFLLMPDGKPTEVSLRDGRLSLADQGDLRVEFLSGQVIANFPSRITCQCRVSIPGGGLIPTNEEFPFLAPEGGYQASDEWSITATNWTEQVNKQYYVKLRDGNFGRVKLRIIGIPGRAYFRLESWLNPSGSRNLEPGN